jgi:hypothetical protein
MLKEDIVRGKNVSRKKTKKAQMGEVKCFLFDWEGSRSLIRGRLSGAICWGMWWVVYGWFDS